MSRIVILNTDGSFDKTIFYQMPPMEALVSYIEEVMGRNADDFEFRKSVSTPGWYIRDWNNDRMIAAFD